MPSGVVIDDIVYYYCRKVIDMRRHSHECRQDVATLIVNSCLLGFLNGC